MHPRRPHLPVRRSRRLRPSLVALEGRELMATLTVTSAADAGPGSLRQVVAASAPGDAINFATALRGSTIRPTSGPISINHSLTINGLGADMLTIDGGGKVGLFAISPAKTGTADPAIAVAIVNMTLSNGLALDGGAIDATHADLTLSGDLVTGNASSSTNLSIINRDGYGGAVRVNGNVPFGQPVGSAITGSLTVRSSVFLNNHAIYGGAIATDNLPISIQGSTFSGNAAMKFGGAVYSGGTSTYQGDQFLENYITSSDPLSFEQGGALLNYDASVVADSYFRGNYIVGYSIQGGAIEDEGTSSVTNSMFVNNKVMGNATAAQAGGGAIGGARLNISTTTFVGNLATLPQGDVSAGAVELAGGTIVNSVFLDNRAVQTVGTILSNAFGGAVMNANALLTIAGGVFLNNLAQAGPGSTAIGGSGAMAGGGAVMSRDSAVTVIGSTFTANSAIAGLGGSGSPAFGGGLYVNGYGPGNDLKVVNSAFTGNVAVGGDSTAAGGVGGTGEGGGIAATGWPASVGLVNVRLVANSAAGGRGPGAGGGSGGIGEGGGLAVDGGLAALSGAATISGGVVVGNMATGGVRVAGNAGAAYGGGVYFNNTGTFGPAAAPTLALVGASIAGNTAQGGAGIVGGEAQGGGLWTSLAVSLDDASTLAGNVARGGPSSGTNVSPGKGYGGGLYRTSTTPRPTVAPRTTIAGNTATTAGNDVYPS